MQKVGIMYDYRQLGRADLNLLVTLQILMTEGSVSRAAERAHVSQSAMSRTLQRLRALFDDPLFVRQSHGLAPTWWYTAASLRPPHYRTPPPSAWCARVIRWRSKI